MSFLTSPDLRLALAKAVRSDGTNGLTTAQDLRTFLALVLDELEAAAATTPTGVAGPGDNLGNHTATQALDLAGHPLVSGTGPVRVRGYAGTPSTVGVLNLTGADRFGQALSLQPAGPGYAGVLGIAYKADGDFGEAFLTGVRLADNRPTHFLITNPAGTTLLALLPDGRLGLGTDAPTEHLEVAGTVKATAFVGDGARLTGLVARPTLEFVFGSGYADGYTATCGEGQAGRYTGQTASNVAQVSYVRNGTELLALPFTLAPGDTLAVAITRAEASLPAVLSLQAA